MHRESIGTVRIREGCTGELTGIRFSWTESGDRVSIPPFCPAGRARLRRDPPGIQLIAKRRLGLLHGEGNRGGENAKHADVLYDTRVAPRACNTGVVACGVVRCVGTTHWTQSHSFRLPFRTGNRATATFLHTSALHAATAAYGAP